MNSAKYKQKIPQNATARCPKFILWIQLKKMTNQIEIGTDRADKLHFSSGYPVFQLPIIRFMSTLGFLNRPETCFVHSYTRMLTRIFHRVSSRGGASGHGYKARAVRATKAYLTICRGARTSATQYTCLIASTQQKPYEISGVKR